MVHLIKKTRVVCKLQERWEDTDGWKTSDGRKEQWWKHDVRLFCCHAHTHTYSCPHTHVHVHTHALTHTFMFMSTPPSYIVVWTRPALPLQPKAAVDTPPLLLQIQYFPLLTGTWVHLDKLWGEEEEDVWRLIAEFICGSCDSYRGVTFTSEMYRGGPHKMRARWPSCNHHVRRRWTTYQGNKEVLPWRL